MTADATEAGTIQADYERLTPTSFELMHRAAKVMPGGSTRTTGWFRPYPVVFSRGSGPYLYDVDGVRYIDLFCNGLSLIHGHAFPPVVEAMERVARTGTAWPGASLQQIEFAELLVDRVPGGGLLRFANTGTEAAMLAVKLARHATDRPAVLKAWAGYHGSYDDLEVGLNGRAEVPGRALLARFNDLGSFEEAFASHPGEIAAVILESVMYTGVVTPPMPGFLSAVQDLARRNGALFILDDCLMMRLAEGGSAERFALEPDLTVLGKFIGGGTPVGAVVGDPRIISVLDPRNSSSMYHGGSFNGNVLGSTCGTIAMRALTPQAIAAMDEDAGYLRSVLEQHALSIGLPFVTSGTGSAFGAYLTTDVPRPAGPRPDARDASQFHLAAISHGVLLGDGNEFALSTVTDRRVVEDAAQRLCAALTDVAAEAARKSD